jgi:excisionase family DNA binding protein
MRASGSQPAIHADDLVTVADAARIAQRSVRTIRRAYRSGRLVAHRDGNGRGVRVRYANLRAWLLAELVAPRPEPSVPRPVAQVAMRMPADGRVKTGHLELLSAARERHARAVAAVRPAGGPARSRPA